jgi:excinuclease ABC subunit B
MPDFELVTPYKAAGDQVKAIQKIYDSFSKGKDKVTLVGVTGSGKTFTMAEVIQKLKAPYSCSFA